MIPTQIDSNIQIKFSETKHVSKRTLRLVTSVIFNVIDNDLHISYSELIKNVVGCWTWPMSLRVSGWTDV